MKTHRELMKLEPTDRFQTLGAGYSLLLNKRGLTVILMNSKEKLHIAMCHVPMVIDYLQKILEDVEYKDE